ISAADYLAWSDSPANRYFVRQAACWRIELTKACGATRLTRDLLSGAPPALGPVRPCVGATCRLLPRATNQCLGDARLPFLRRWKPVENTPERASKPLHEGQAQGSPFPFGQRSCSCC